MPFPDQDTPGTVAIRAGWREAGVTGLILLVFGGVVALVSLDLRARLRSEVLQREGEVLRAVAAMERAVIADTAVELELPVLDEPFEVALHTSENWQGVLAVRLFDTAGGFLDAVPREVFEGTLSPEYLRELGASRPVVAFHRAYALEDLFLVAAHELVAPLLEVNVPLAPAGEADGETVFVQFWIDGQNLAGELAQLDRRVAWQAGVAFAAGALLIGGTLFWAFRRLEGANRLLAAHADDLSRANRELAQSARTSAIGTITAHLMHGLRNPLAGLEGFVASQGSPDESGETEWSSARESTRRLRAMVNEVQAVLSDVDTGADFAVTAGELCAGLCERLQSHANRRGVRIDVEGSANVVLSARAAGLGGLVLANLAQNAIEASPSDARVVVKIGASEGWAEFIVLDQGPGLPLEVSTDPFRPRRSTKPDGAGIGLAISRELARHGGGDLTLVYNSAAGAAFRLQLPTVASPHAREVT